jgi:hypothetical protein
METKQHEFHTLVMSDDIRSDPIVATKTKAAMTLPLESCSHNLTTCLFVVDE